MREGGREVRQSRERGENGWEELRGKVGRWVEARRVGNSDTDGLPRAPHIATIHIIISQVHGLIRHSGHLTSWGGWGRMGWDGMGWERKKKYKVVVCWGCRG